MVEVRICDLAQLKRRNFKWHGMQNYNVLNDIALKASMPLDFTKDINMINGITH